MEENLKRLGQIIKGNTKINYENLLEFFPTANYDEILMLVIRYFNDNIDSLSDNDIYRLFHFLDKVSTYTKIVSFSKLKIDLELFVSNIQKISKTKNIEIGNYLNNVNDIVTKFLDSKDEVAILDHNSFEFVMYIIKNVRKLEYCEEIFKNFPEILTIKKNSKYIINNVLNEYIHLILHSPDSLMINYYNQIFNFITKYSYKNIDENTKSEIISKLEKTRVDINKKNINQTTKKKIDLIINSLISRLNGSKFRIYSLNNLNLYYNININYKDYALYNDKHKRSDYTNLLTFTIDDSKSGLLDDAVSFKKNLDGTYTLGIYVADNSGAILRNTPFDKELRNRSETIYMLKNHIHLFDYDFAYKNFSLIVNTTKKVIAYIYRFSPEFDLIDFKIERAIINPKKNFSHHEVDDIFNKSRNNISNRELFEILKQLRIFIEKVGFDIDQINSYHEFKTITRNLYGTNFKNRLIDGEKSKDIGSLIISILMILTKNTVALEMYKKNYPFIYINNGFKLDDKLTNLLNNYKENPNNKEIISYIKKLPISSTYGIENLGHNGLNIEANCEITNPIRKYMSIESSRLVKQFLIDKVVLSSKDEENLRHYLDKLYKEQNQIYFNHQLYINEAKTIIKKNRH